MSVVSRTYLHPLLQNDLLCMAQQALTCMGLSACTHAVHPVRHGLAIDAKIRGGAVLRDFVDANGDNSKLHTFLVWEIRNPHLTSLTSDWTRYVGFRGNRFADSRRRSY